MRFSPRSRAVVAIGIAVSALCLYLLVRRLDLQAVRAALARADPSILLLSLITKALGFLALAARSKVLLGGSTRISYRLAVRAHLLGFGGNAVLPLRIGEVLRAGYLSRRSGARLATCAAVVASERMLDAFWLLAVALPILPRVLPGGAPPVLLYALGAVALVLAAAVLLGRSATAREEVPQGPELGTQWRRFGQAARSGLRGLGSPSRLVAGSVLTLLYWGASAAGIALWIRGFGLELPWHAPVVVLGFIAFGAALPAAPGFVGTYHLFAARGVGVYGVGPETAAAFAIAGHFLAVVPFALLAVALLFDELVRGWRRPDEG